MFPKFADVALRLVDTREPIVADVANMFPKFAEVAFKLITFAVLLVILPHVADVALRFVQLIFVSSALSPLTFVRLNTL